MKRVTNQILSYGFWIVDLALAFWLAFLSRHDLLAFLALFYKEGTWSYPHWVIVIDRVYIVTVGLGWLAFMVVVEAYFRAGIQKGDILLRFLRVTGPLILCIFIIDLIYFWLQGINSQNWIRWLILAIELTVGIGLVTYYKSKTIIKTK